jgi:hypothetical protein
MKGYVVIRYVPGENGCCGRPSYTDTVVFCATLDKAEQEVARLKLEEPTEKVWHGSDEDDYELVACKYHYEEIPAYL